MAVTEKRRRELIRIKNEVIDIILRKELSDLEFVWLVNTIQEQGANIIGQMVFRE